jgi:hypothetical protein
LQSVFVPVPPAQQVLSGANIRISFSIDAICVRMDKKARKSMVNNRFRLKQAGESNNLLFPVAP